MNSGCLIFIPGINSLTHRERFTTTYDFPRGGLSLASFLESRGKRVSIIPLDYYIPRSSDPEEIRSRLRSVVQSAVKEFDPALIGIGVPYTMLYPTALRVASFCKEVSEAVVCVGGPHVSYMDRQTLMDSKDVDLVVRGEGEWSLLELLERIERGEDYTDVAGTTVRLYGDSPDSTTPLIPLLIKEGSTKCGVVRSGTVPLGMSYTSKVLGDRCIPTLSILSANFGHIPLALNSPRTVPSSETPDIL